MIAIFDVETQTKKFREFTQDELEKFKKENLLSPTIIAEPADVEKIAMAEAIIDLNTQMEDLKNKIDKLTGGK